MRKGKFFLLALSVVTALAILPVSTASASSSGLTLIKTEEHEFKGEVFQIQTLKDGDGIEYTRIPTPVENKVEIAEYVENLKNPSKIVPFAGTTDWTRNISNSSSNATVSMTTSGETYFSLIPPITEDTLTINQGSMTGYWFGSGNADKIVLSYKYEFSALLITLSFPPMLVKDSSTLSWTSLPIEDEWNVTAQTETATGKSRFQMNGVTITAYADVYKGNNVYKPKASTYVMYSSPNHE
ncbi:hypothetical protein [Paenibacillus camelliae]|uniref:hypothetical protein n=1 Tax=Paenibacillus camelliae TaxID=512410 RepID=UPI002041107D|nr:hypothetical protein [Paenibacillus camelliae]MCM3632628.1 hypothetical protein [Paenibacillus camelliae]